MVITFLRNVGHRLKEICIFWQQLKRQGDYTDQLARFRQAEMLNAKGNDGQSHRQPYRGEVISIADAGAREHRRDPLRHGGDVRGDVA
jgi:hypothetical protein